MNLKLKTKFMLSLLPGIALIFAIVIFLVARTTTIIVSRHSEKEMNFQLNQEVSLLNNTLQKIENSANMLALSIEATGGDLIEPVLINTIISTAESDDIICGSGIWLEPNTIDDKIYYGPYAYKDNGNTSIIWDYSNAEYDYFNQDYYLISKEHDKAIFTDPYYDETTDITMSTCVAPIIINNHFYGCVTVDFDLTSLQDAVDNIVVGQEGRAFLYDNANTLIAGEDITSDKVNVKSGTVGDTGWVLSLALPTDELMEDSQMMMGRLLFLGIVSMILITGIVFFEVKTIIKSIDIVKNNVNQLSEGDLKIDVNERLEQNVDELGDMYRDLNSCVNSITDIVLNIDETAEHINNSSEQINSISSTSQETSNSITEAINEIAQGAMQTAEDIQDATVSVDSMGESIEAVVTKFNELSDMFNSVLTFSNQTKNLVHELQQSNVKAKEAITEVGQDITNTNEFVNQISEATALITNIAKQTNLLSLNASIEAARVGEAGRGFAVVAHEIGSLSNQSNQSAKEIQDIINELVNSASIMLHTMQTIVAASEEQSTKLAETINAFDEIIIGIEKTESIINELHTQVQICDQARGSVIDVIGSISAITEEQAASTEETTASMTTLNTIIESLADLAKQLHAFAGNLKEEIKFFKF